MQKLIPFSPPDIREEDIQAVEAVLRSGWITTGPECQKFEAALAEFTGAERAICLNSATAALELSLRILGIGPGDEVITSAYTYTASASVICHVGATPVLVDVTKDSLVMDPDALARAVTKRTKAIISVDVGGVQMDYPALFALAEEKKPLFQAANAMQSALNRIAVIADVAHSLGATRGEQRSGSAADFSCLSFHAVKNLTTAEGGALLFGAVGGVPAEELYRQLRLYALHGQSKDAMSKSKAGQWEYDIVMLGYKYNMTDISAALGLSQLRRYPEILNRRHEIYRAYQAAFSDLPLALLAHEGADFRSSAHLAITRALGLDPAQRNALIEKMSAAGIVCNVHYKPLPMMTAYQKLGFSIADYPNAYDFFSNEITLPLHTLLTDEDVAYICATYRRLLLG